MDDLCLCYFYMCVNIYFYVHLHYRMTVIAIIDNYFLMCCQQVQMCFVTLR